MKKTVYTIFFITILTMGIFVYNKTETYSQNETSQAELDELTNEIAEKKSKIKKIEASIAEYRKKIATKRLESVSLSNQMAILENRIEEVTLDIELTEEKIATIELELTKLVTDITQKNNIIENQKQITAELLRALQKNSDRSFVEILAAYDDFSDFYSKLQYIKTVEGDLAQNTKNIKLAKVELEEKQNQAEERNNSYKALQEKLTNRQEDLEEQIFAKDEVLTITKSSEMKYKTLVVNLKNQYRAVENEIAATERSVREKIEKNKQFQNIVQIEDTSKLSWPTDSRYITSRFHDPDYPYRHIFEHSGIDIRAKHGTALKASSSGYVARAKRCNSASCYSYVMIIHPNGISTVYGHMSNIQVSVDQFVHRGDLIGYTGGTPGTIGAGPFVTGPHLHYEVRKNGIQVNPLNFLVRDW